eukprot:GFYU01002782.1.p1 GENE.GFYU01002782.1~~GFYU01002782.1.p1  ORF type:complete len:475 (-),score=122.81 GFYU01002782.1:1400-2824(-)
MKKRDFYTPGMECVQAAVTHDEKGEHKEAIPLYAKAVEYMILHLKYEKNEAMRKKVQDKASMCLSRAEQIKTQLKETAAVAKVANVPAPPKRPPPTADQIELRKQIETQMIQERGDTTLDDVVGMEDVKQSLREAIHLPAKFPQLFTGARKPTNTVLMYGPPGTGKTYVAKSLASETGSTFIPISSSDLIHKSVGQSEKLVRALFDVAVDRQPCIIFIDEIDSLARTRSDTENESERRIKNELLIRLEEVRAQPGVVVLAATNTPWQLDPAIRRRFDRRLYIPLPETEARKEILKVHLDSEVCEVEDDALAGFAAQTDGYSAADLNVVAREALMEPVRECLQSKYWQKATVDGKEMYKPAGFFNVWATKKSVLEIAPDKLYVRPVVKEDVQKAVNNVKPTVCAEELTKYDEYTKHFGMSHITTVPLEDTPITGGILPSAPANLPAAPTTHVVQPPATKSTGKRRPSGLRAAVST